MPDPRYANCRRCGRHRDEVGFLSWTRLCNECSNANAAENLIDLMQHSGPGFRRWRRAIAASVGGVLLDEQPDAD